MNISWSPEAPWDPITMRSMLFFSLSSIMPFYNALRFTEPSELGLAGNDGKAYVQCPDACEHTGGGTVVFEIIKEHR